MRGCTARRTHATPQQPTRQQYSNELMRTRAAHNVEQRSHEAPRLSLRQSRLPAPAASMWSKHDSKTCSATPDCPAGGLRESLQSTRPLQKCLRAALCHACIRRALRHNVMLVARNFQAMALPLPQESSKRPRRAHDCSQFNRLPAACVHFELPLALSCWQCAGVLGIAVEPPYSPAQQHGCARRRQREPRWALRQVRALLSLLAAGSFSPAHGSVLLAGRPLHV